MQLKLMRVIVQTHMVDFNIRIQYNSYMKEKDELLQIFPTPVLITKYDGDISEETKYVENLEYKDQKENKNFRSKDSYLFKHEPLKKIKIFCGESITKYLSLIHI